VTGFIIGSRERKPAITDDDDDDDDITTTTTTKMD